MSSIEKENANQLTKEQLTSFKENGYLAIPNFFDIATDIEPIQKDIHQIINIIIKKYSLDIEPNAYSAESFDDNLLSILNYNRKYISEIYDAVKQIPAFIRLISHKKLENLFTQLRNNAFPGIGQASFGIRIDLPHEEQFRSQWHQEFLSQPQSIDGIVYWSPLVPLTKDMGPVIICKRSHKDGLKPVSKQGEYNGKLGAYKVGLVNEKEVIKQYQHISPITNPGDLLLLDFLTIHQSGFNVSNRARLSIQARFFNFNEPIGQKIGWKPSVTTGTDIEEIFKDYFKKDAS